jgi:hypothetical protein
LEQHNADGMNPTYLSVTIIEFNLLHGDARKILQMCLNKAVKMDEILEKAFGKDSDKRPRDQGTQKFDDG